MSVCREDEAQAETGTSSVYNMSSARNSTADYEYYAYYDISDSAGQFWHYDASIVIVKYIWPVVIVAGTVGNILSFLVLIRRRMRRTPVYFYLAMLACADTSVLYLSGFKTWLRVVTGLEILHLSDAACKICTFLFLHSLHLSAFFVIAMTTDRFLTMFFPFKKSSYRLMSRAPKLFSALACLLLVAYNSHVFWTFRLRSYSDGWKTCSPVLVNTFMCDVFPWLKLSLYTVVPFILVFTLNSATVLKMYETQRHFRQNDDSSRSSRLSVTQYRVTVMLLGVSVSWLLLTAPFTLFSFISRAGQSTLQDDAKYFFIKTLCFTLLYVNHGVNFYIYCLSGQRFRQELLQVLVTMRRWSIRSRKTSSLLVRHSNRDAVMLANNRAGML